MKTKRYAEETEGYDLESKTELDVPYVTSAETEAIQYASKRMLEAVLQSGLRFIKVVRDDEDGFERLFLDAEDCSASVVANLVSDLRGSEYGFEFSGTMQSMDTLAVTYNFEPEDAEDNGGEEFE